MGSTARAVDVRVSGGGGEGGGEGGGFVLRGEVLWRFAVDALVHYPVYTARVPCLHTEGGGSDGSIDGRETKGEDGEGTVGGTGDDGDRDHTRTASNRDCASASASVSASVSAAFGQAMCARAAALCTVLAAKGVAAGKRRILIEREPTLFTH